METDISLLEKLFDGENEDSIFLFDEDGNEIELEQIAALEHNGGVYAVLHVVGDPEEEVLVFKVDTEDEETITIVEDEDLANEILKIVTEGA